MKFHTSSVAAFSILLTAGINISSVASAAPIKVEKQDKVQSSQVERNKKSETNTTKKSRNDSKKPAAPTQGGKCSFWGGC